MGELKKVGLCSRFGDVRSGGMILTTGHLSKSYLRGMKGTTCIKL